MAEKIEKTYLVARELSKKHKTARIIDVIVVLDDLPQQESPQGRYNALLYVTTKIEYDVLKKRHPGAEIVYLNNFSLSSSEAQYLRNKKPEEISANKMLLYGATRLKRFEKSPKMSKTLD